MNGYVIFAGCLAALATWNLCKCTLFAAEFERESVLYMLAKFRKRPDDAAAMMAAERTAREYRLKLVPVWLTASAFCWAYLVFELMGATK